MEYTKWFCLLPTSFVPVVCKFSRSCASGTISFQCPVQIMEIKQSHRSLRVSNGRERRIDTGAPHVTGRSTLFQCIIMSSTSNIESVEKTCKIASWVASMLISLRKPRNHLRVTGAHQVPSLRDRKSSVHVIWANVLVACTRDGS